MTVYERIDRALKQHEQHKYAELSMESIGDYLDWAWRWRKITEEQKNELVGRWLVIWDAEWCKEYGNYD